MPHVIVKMYPGRTEQQKQELAAELTKTVIRVLNSKETSISVGIEDVTPEEWAANVHAPDIAAKPTTIFKHSGT
jgi:4-oxalocrotonate tautomerase